MRAIKFRAWDGKTVFPINNGPISVTNGQLSFPVYDGEGRIVDCELMQFTGLTDVNGVEVYEGDIVCIRKDRFGAGEHEAWSVIYGYFGDAAFYVHNHLNSGRMIEVDEYPHFDPDGKGGIPLEVIGNIHQNPELLK